MLISVCIFAVSCVLLMSSATLIVRASCMSVPVAMVLFILCQWGFFYNRLCSDATVCVVMHGIMFFG